MSQRRGRAGGRCGNVRGCVPFCRASLPLRFMYRVLRGLLIPPLRLKMTVRVRVWRSITMEARLLDMSGTATTTGTALRRVTIVRVTGGQAATIVLLRGFAPRTVRTVTTTMRDKGAPPRLRPATGTTTTVTGRSTKMDLAVFWAILGTTTGIATGGVTNRTSNWIAHLHLPACLGWRFPGIVMMRSR